MGRNCWYSFIVSFSPKIIFLINIIFLKVTGYVCVCVPVCTERYRLILKQYGSTFQSFLKGLKKQNCLKNEAGVKQFKI